MPVPHRALTSETLGAWLVKATGSVPATTAHVRAGFAGVATWCVRPTYRTELVAAGQPVLLWVSGTEREHPAGIYAAGRTTGRADGDLIPIALSPLAHPLLRSELTGHPGLTTLEVLRMPAGSNPSFVTHAELRVLVELCPELGRELGPVQAAAGA
ncbi:hypothetical protein [Nocardioides sp.]|uniref:hypothetical protein n=1 Tax=Nocardioides sp. TaxID=35761 RepID=UPI00260A10B0|nr:hypothetical protein [Nocardioides sp.]MCW2735424.1 hypothetical protein [Nocardioides sp.]